MVFDFFFGCFCFWLMFVEGEGRLKETLAFLYELEGLLTGVSIGQEKI